MAGKSVLGETGPSEVASGEVAGGGGREATRRLQPLRRFGPAFLYLICALYFTWPLVRAATTHVLDDAWTRGTVPLLNVWILEWNADRILHGYQGDWDAPIFHGIAGSFAFSEPQLLTGIVYGALRWVFGSPALAYNAVMWTMLRGCPRFS